MNRLQKSKLGRMLSKLLTAIKGIDYTKPMMEPETKIHPEVYKDIKKRYDEASKLRRQEIRRLIKEGWTQKEVADFYHVDVSRINKIIKEPDEE